MQRNRAGESQDTTIGNSWRPSTTSRSTVSPGGRFPASTANGTVYGSDFGGSADPGYSRHSFRCWRIAARRHTWSSSSTARPRAPTSRPPGQKGAAAPRIRPLARRLLDQNPSQDRSRRPPSRLPPDRRRGQRQHRVRDITRHRAGHPAAHRGDRQGI